MKGYLLMIAKIHISFQREGKGSYTIKCLESTIFQDRKEIPGDIIFGQSLKATVRGYSSSQLFPTKIKMKAKGQFS